MNDVTPMGGRAGKCSRPNQRGQEELKMESSGYAPPSPLGQLGLKELSLVVKKGLQFLYPFTLCCKDKIVFLIRQGHQIRKAIVRSNTIQMMNYPALRKFPIVGLFPNIPMFLYTSTIWEYKAYIAVSIAASVSSFGSFIATKARRQITRAAKSSFPLLRMTNCPQSLSAFQAIYSRTIEVARNPPTFITIKTIPPNRKGVATKFAYAFHIDYHITRESTKQQGSLSPGLLWRMLYRLYGAASGKRQRWPQAAKGTQRCSSSMAMPTVNFGLGWRENRPAGLATQPATKGGQVSTETIGRNWSCGSDRACPHYQSGEG